MKDDKARALDVYGNPPNVPAPVGDGRRVIAARGDLRADGNANVPAGLESSRALVAGLECRVGKAPIVVPVEHVAQIVEYEITRLPLTRRWITGVGLHDERLVMTVGLVAEPPGAAAPERRRTKGVLLNVPDSKISWALEVQEVVVLVHATVIERRGGEPRAGDLPPWIGRARTSDGRSIAWIDVPAMLADLTSLPRALA